MRSPLERAIDRLRDGGVVVYPTDTLVGLGADARNEEAVQRLVELKGRSSSQPISIALSSYEELEPFSALPIAGRAFLRRNLPGPYTLLLPPSSGVAKLGLARPVNPPGGAIGVRIPDHPLARALARAVGPITATSANRHGEPPARSVAQARRTFGNAVDAYVDGPPAPSGRPSTLVDLSRRDAPQLRPR